MRTFPLGDAPTLAEREKYGQAAWSWAQRGQHEGLFLRAVMSGECRPPKKGEWYLSGAIIEAYRAPNDLSETYHIARLVKVERTIVERILP